MTSGTVSVLSTADCFYDFISVAKAWIIQKSLLCARAYTGLEHVLAGVLSVYYWLEVHMLTNAKLSTPGPPLTLTL